MFCFRESLKKGGHSAPLSWELGGSFAAGDETDRLSRLSRHTQFHVWCVDQSFSRRCGILAIHRLMKRDVGKYPVKKGSAAWRQQGGFLASLVRWMDELFVNFRFLFFCCASAAGGDPTQSRHRPTYVAGASPPLIAAPPPLAESLGLLRRASHRRCRRRRLRSSRTAPRFVDRIWSGGQSRRSSPTALRAFLVCVALRGDRERRSVARIGSGVREIPLRGVRERRR